MVTNHEAFGYFAAHYGFLVLGVVIPGGSTLAEPSSAHVAELVGIMERTGARVVFAETSRPTALAEAVAAELGEEVEVVELFTESLGGPGSGAESLPEMLVTNAERIAAALGTPAPG
jgi:zinc/manganese transport system substrate-binding protein